MEGSKQVDPRITARLEKIGKKILVLSGKGGVGKSTVSAQLALALHAQGFRVTLRSTHGAKAEVGLLDLDICGPSIPHMFGLGKSEVFQGSDGWVPVHLDPEKRLAVMSIGFLLDDPDKAVVWRGPRKNAMIVQFISEVTWGELDYLICDTPPGTSDEHLSIVEVLKYAKDDGVVMVTTPQEVALTDVRKEINFCHKLDLKIFGVVENMSGFICPNCSAVHNIFSTGGGEKMAKDYGINFLGRIPIDPKLAMAGDKGENFLATFAGSPCATALLSIVDGVKKEAERITE